MLSPNEIRQQITSQIVQALSNGNLPPWRRLWSNDPNAPGLHTSLSTGNGYTGVNQLLLQLSAGHHGFQSKWWGTINQIKASGGYVCRGQKATKIILWKPISRKRKNGQGEEGDDEFLVMQEFYVFNIEQTLGLNQFQVGYAQRKTDTGERCEHADVVIEATGADIRYGGNEAYYRSGEDFIQMPFRHQFESAEAFAAAYRSSSAPRSSPPSCLSRPEILTKCETAAIPTFT
jgi:antirestriction protein ArdC